MSRTIVNPQGSASTTIDIQNPPLVVDMQDSISASCVDNTVIAVDIVSGAGDYTYDMELWAECPMEEATPRSRFRAL